MERFEDYGILGVNYAKAGNQYLICPKCSNDRKKKTDKCLGVHATDGVWGCNHCGWSGYLKKQTHQFSKHKEYVIPQVIQSALSNKALLWLECERKIERATIEHFKLFSATKYFHAKGDQPAGERPCIGFPYYRGETILNCKYRDGAKRFTLEQNAELLAYNENSILGHSEIVIVEGELDALSVWQSGHRAVISTPAGANLNKNNLEWLDKIYPELEKVEKIYIAVDQDAPGESLKSDICRRFDSEKIWIVSWPDDCKDANDVLVRYGPEKIKTCISQAKQIPIDGIITHERIVESVSNYYQNGLPQGDKIKWNKFSDLLQFIRGEFIVVTGIPTHGKSVWCENYMVQLAKLHGRKFGICVFESDPDITAMNLAQQITGKKFFGQNRIGQIDIEYALSFIKNHFFFFDVEESSNTLDAVLKKGRELVKRNDIDAIYIDPWSYIEKDMGRMSESQYFESQLPKIRSFKKKNNCTIMIVAHPRKMERDKSTGLYRTPEAYDISGSNQWYGAPDKIISVYAHYADSGNITHHTIHVQKQKKWWLGRKGSVDFKMLENGEFVELSDFQLMETYSQNYKYLQSNDDIAKPNPDEFSISGDYSPPF